jgi:glucose uptake protein GlcU
MCSEYSTWTDRLFVIGLILALFGIILLCVAGLIFVEGVDYHLTDFILAGIILIVIGAVIAVVLDRLD